MQKTVYYSKKYQAQQATAGPDANTAPVVVQPSARRTMKLGGIVLASCLALALLLVVLVPVLAGGAAPVASQGAHVADGSGAAMAQHQYVAYASVQAAAAALELKAAVPTVLPEGFSLLACSVVDGSILELSFTDNNTTVLFRAAAGNDDLSWADPGQFGYHASETVGSVTRSYMGGAEDSFRVAVWAARGHSYALVSDAALDAGVMRRLAEGVA